MTLNKSSDFITNSSKQHGIFNKHVVIFSPSDLLLKSIKDNLPAIKETGTRNTRTKHIHSNESSLELILSNQTSSIFLCSKIDLLIIDFNGFDFHGTEFYKIKTVINLTNENIFSKDEIKLPKPFRLNNLLKLIEELNRNQDVFCSLNSDFIYDERSHTIASPEKLVKLTKKENDIFKFILLSPDFKTTKESLLTDVWKYNEHTETLTVDTHLYKLKAKLPAEILKVRNNICQLSL